MSGTRLSDRHSSFIFFSVYSIFLIVIPLSFLTFDAFQASTNSVFFDVIERGFYQSLLQATLSTAISFVLGIGAGMLLIIYNGRLKNVILSMMLITYVMPGIIMSLGILTLFHYNMGFADIIYGNVIYNAPMIAVLTYSAASLTSFEEIKSAKVLGANDGRIISDFYFHNSIKGGLLGALFSFILCFEGFSLPLIVGGPTFTTLEVYIYLFKREFVSISSFPFSGASFVSMLQFISLLLPLVAYISIRSQQTRVGTGISYKFRSSNYVIPFLVAFLLFIFSPLISMFSEAPLNLSSLSGIQARIGIGVPTLTMNTVLFSFASTFLAVLVSLYIASRFSRGTVFLVMLPMIVSPVSLALAFYLAYGSISGSFILLIIIFTALVIPVTIRMMQQAFLSIPSSERFSSRVLGDSSFSSAVKIQLGRVRAEIVTVISLIFITVMGEFSAVATVYTPSTETLTIGIYNLLSVRDFRGSYSLTEIFVIVIFISAFAINHLGKSDVLGETYS
ncbi:MAG: ABC transporter permease subunit [Candidatus Thermoplasmatota archaeon]|nr:ABC transporter permease subunit [Candidatus Thermoplasmatota archaeon]